MNELLPRAVLPYAKAWVSFIGTLVAAILVAWPEAPHWLVIASSALTAAAVYFTPNRDPMAQHQDESTQPPQA